MYRNPLTKVRCREMDYSVRNAIELSFNIQIPDKHICMT